MSKQLLAGKIVSLRKSKGMSQEVLADASEINLRTLQRIEAGRTEPRGQTLRLIAKALDLSLEDLLDTSTEEFQAQPKEDIRFLHTLNLSALTFWFIPLGNIFVPLILWGMRRDKTWRVARLWKQLITFQVIWTVLVYGYAYLGILKYRAEPPFGVSNLQLILGLCVLNSVFILITAFQIRRGSNNVYSTGFAVSE